MGASLITVHTGLCSPPRGLHAVVEYRRLATADAKGALSSSEKTVYDEWRASLVSGGACCGGRKVEAGRTRARRAHRSQQCTLDSARRPAACQASTQGKKTVKLSARNCASRRPSWRVSLRLSITAL